MSPGTHRIAVGGGGIAGLALAHDLKKRLDARRSGGDADEVEIVVLEKSGGAGTFAATSSAGTPASGP